MHLRSLPAPDVLEFDLPEGHILLLIDDGTDLAPVLACRLQALDWRVVVLRLLDEGLEEEANTVFSDSVPVVRIAATAETTVAAEIDQLREEHGPIAACVVLTPPALSGRDVGASEPFDALQSRDNVRVAFLLAKHLHGQLTAAAYQCWGGFFVVTRVDGALGMLGGSDPLPAASGLTGLTKTLGLEWPNVACRTVDLAPDLQTAAAADAVVGELLDPNRLVVEVGWSEAGRVTLDAGVHAPLAGLQETDYVG